MFVCALLCASWSHASVWLQKHTRVTSKHWWHSRERVIYRTILLYCLNGGKCLLASFLCDRASTPGPHPLNVNSNSRGDRTSLTPPRLARGADTGGMWHGLEWHLTCCFRPCNHVSYSEPHLKPWSPHTRQVCKNVSLLCVVGLPSWQVQACVSEASRGNGHLPRWSQTIL